MSVNLETKLLSRNFSQKTNVTHYPEMLKIMSFVRFLGEVTRLIDLYFDLSSTYGWKITWTTLHVPNTTPIYLLGSCLPKNWIHLTK